MVTSGRIGFAAAILVLAACASSQAGPELPRPAVSIAEVTTTSSTVAPTTTTTVDEARTCPTPFCLLYHIREEASWSDGSPVTAADFVATARLALDPRLENQHPGYALIEAMTVLDDKTLRVEMSRPLGDWPGLFDHLLPESWDGRGVPPLTTGRFEVSDQLAGDRIVLNAVPSWWAETDPASGDAPGDVTEIRLVFPDDLGSMLDGLEGGEYDVLIGRPDTSTHGRLESREAIDFQLTPGPFWEHIDFRHDDPLLSQPWVRRAIAMAIDREKILDETIRLVAPDASGLGNTLVMQGSPSYEEHYRVGFDPVAAEQILIDNGCTRDGSAPYECFGASMRFRWVTTDDDPARRNALELASASLDDIGIEIVADYRSPSSFVTREFLFAGVDVWQIASFSWRAAVDPELNTDTLRCEGSLNVNRACIAEVDDILDRAAKTTDLSERAELYNLADARYQSRLPLIPLYQKPELFAWSRALIGPRANPRRSTHLWNVNSWSGMESVVIALAGEPDLSLSGAGNELTEAVWSALLLGAHAWTPDGEMVPVLVESVELLEGSG